MAVPKVLRSNSAAPALWHIACAHLLLDRFRKSSANASRRETQLTLLEVGRLLVERERGFGCGLDELSRSLSRRERSSSTAAASFIRHIAACTVSRPSCSSAAIRLWPSMTT